MRNRAKEVEQLERDRKIHWRTPRYKRHWRDICAILPQYLNDDTNGCVIHYIDGTCESLHATLKWVVEDLLAYLGTDKAQLHKQSARLLRNKKARRLPLMVKDGFTLVPVKGRHCPNGGSGVSGYIVLEYVQTVRWEEHNTTVRLVRDQNIAVLDSARTLKQNIKLAHTLHLLQQIEALE